MQANRGCTEYCEQRRWREWQEMRGRNEREKRPRLHRAGKPFGYWRSAESCRINSGRAAHGQSCIATALNGIALQWPARSQVGANIFSSPLQQFKQRLQQQGRQHGNGVAALDQNAKASNEEASKGLSSSYSFIW